MPTNDAPAGTLISIEVIFALPAKYVIEKLKLPSGSTAENAVLKSGMASSFPEISVGVSQLSCFGHLIGWKTQLHGGDRVEILRPLAADPKESRRRRARIQAVIKIGPCN